MEKVKKSRFFTPPPPKRKNTKANKTNSFILIGQGTGLLIITRECAILKRLFKP